ncbi:ATPase family associated with various cellular activities (AAA) [Polystyrenella longa]|uniref:ATPase family associated with various cellular activities (AAA) n=1 Tax=Polystyrenella longa TaxID=2528007 RepID=A0A518CHT5_9PLAN|nr:MoxR family ATPase [Polystyrenella longa]QDU78789.1 ATPase family associated with various cellular activities (AAA) [Polystyrenella longa]
MNSPVQENEVLQAEADHFKQQYQEAKDQIGRVIVGQERVIEASLTALLCGGNILLEGVPGLGKTELVKAMSQVLDLEFRRIQFTPDLMPADIIGTNIMSTDETGKYRFEFRKGPIFTQLLLADEINRASPKTQSALLETMQEGTVTTGGTIHTLAQPFFVMATQNPIEQEGTYPLPEAQLDRFMFKVDVPFMSRHELNEIVTRTILRNKVNLEKTLDSERILELRRILDKVVVADPMRDYAVRLVLATHPATEFSNPQIEQFIRWGASPRAAQSLIRAARVRALSQGRVHVSYEDIRYFGVEVLQHRALLNYDGQAENVSVSTLVSEMMEQLPEEA